MIVQPDYLTVRPNLEISSGRSAFGSETDVAAPLINVRYSPKKRTLFGTIVMSALCQKRTFCTAERASLFDHLVGAIKQLPRHDEA